MDRKQIIMNFHQPPNLEDLQVIAEAVLEAMPEELQEFCDSLVVQIEDMPDDIIVQELDLDDAFELTALYKSGGEISPGVEKKVANDDDVIILFRRPILDLWCETCDEFNDIVRQVIIEELAPNFDFSDDEIDDMTSRHYQGML